MVILLVYSILYGVSRVYVISTENVKSVIRRMQFIQHVAKVNELSSDKNIDIVQYYTERLSYRNILKWKNVDYTDNLYAPCGNYPPDLVEKLSGNEGSSKTNRTESLEGKLAAGTLVANAASTLVSNLVV